LRNNGDVLDRSRKGNSKLWILRRFSYYMTARFTAVHSPTKHLAVDEVIVNFKGKVVFCQFILRNKTVSNEIL
jgi:hypothetical protein